MRTNELTDGISCGRRHPGVPPLAAAAVAVTAFAAVALAASLLYACSEGDETWEFPQSGGMPLSFLTTVEKPQTRAELNTDNLTAIGVFAYLTDGDFSESTATPGFMFNQKVERANNASPWTYSPLKYWPNNPDDKISFFAYAPYVDETAAGGSNPTFQEKTTATGFPTLTYTVPTAEADQADLLVSVPLMNRTYSTDDGSKIPFSMKHALTKVNIIMKNGDSDQSQKTVNSFSLKAKQQGTLTYTNSGFGWNVASASTATFTPANSSDISIPATKDETLTIATFYLIPDKTGANFSMKYTMQGNVGMGETAPQRVITVTDKAFPDTPAWTAGGTVNYIITLKKEQLSIVAEAGTSWEEDTNNHANIKTYIAGDLKPGDYYYSDGTYSDGGLRAANMTTGECTFEPPLPGPETGKTCAGVVFYAGRHPKDDCIYTTKEGTSMVEVHGYAVSLSDLGKAFDTKGGGWVYYNYGEAEEVLYLVGTPTDTDDYRGYSNTHLIESVAKERGVWDAGFYLPNKVLNSYTPFAPSVTSGWYMPSAGQMLDLYKYKVALQTVMAQLGKTLVGSSANGGTYWTSTETGASTAYKFDDFKGNSGHLNSYWKGGRDATRPVFTF